MYIFAKNTWHRKRRHRCRLGRVRYTYYNYSVQVGAKLPFDGQVSTPQPHVRIANTTRSFASKQNVKTKVQSTSFIWDDKISLQLVYREL
jgi:hypothetical protein